MVTHRGLTFLTCVGAAVLLSAGALSASVYDLSGVGGDMYVNETTGPGTNPFGAWSLGYRTLAQGINSDAFTAMPDHQVPDPNFNLRGWGVNANTAGLPGIYVNTNSWVVSNAQPGDILVHPGEQGQMTVARWTAPERGYITTTTTFRKITPDTAGAVDIHVVLDGVSVFDHYSYGLPYDATHGSDANGVYTFTLPSVHMYAGYTLDVVVGYGADQIFNNDATIITHSLTFSPVPEPGTLILAIMGLLGWLAYAWHKRK